MLNKTAKLLLLVALLHWLPVWADEADVFNLTTSITTMRDDNLFRLPSNRSAESAGLAAKADTLTSASVGLNMNKQLGLQRFIANVNFSENRYSRFTYLNFRGLNYDAKWQWSLTPKLKGEVFIDRSQSPGGFANNTNYQNRNIRIIENQRFSADYQFHSTWYLVGGLSHNSLKNEQIVFEESDFDSYGYNLGLSYRNGAGNSLTYRYKHDEGKYGKRDINSSFAGTNFFDNEYTQDGHELSARWQYSGKSLFSARAEYLERKHPHFQQRNYAGWAGGLDYTYGGTQDKLNYTLSYKRGLGAFQLGLNQSYLGSFTTSDIYSFNLQWAMTGKLTLIPRASYTRQEFDGRLANFIPQRVDRIRTLGADLSYRALRALELRMGYAFERRLSTYNSLEYVDRIITLSANATF